MFLYHALIHTLCNLIHMLSEMCRFYAFSLSYSSCTTNVLYDVLMHADIYTFFIQILSEIFMHSHSHVVPALPIYICN
jgi:hypothetical protein